MSNLAFISALVIFSFDGLLLGGLVLVLRKERVSFYLLPIPPSFAIPLVLEYLELERLQSDERSPTDLVWLDLELFWCLSEYDLNIEFFDCCLRAV
jgi:hypothetical protein